MNGLGGHDLLVVAVSSYPTSKYPVYKLHRTSLLFFAWYDLPV